MQEGWLTRKEVPLATPVKFLLSCKKHMMIDALLDHMFSLSFPSHAIRVICAEYIIKPLYLEETGRNWKKFERCLCLYVCTACLPGLRRDV